MSEVKAFTILNSGIQNPTLQEFEFELELMNTGLGDLLCWLVIV